jgi:hypothetical protein
MQRPLVPLVFAAALGACVASNGDEGIFITKNVAPGDGCTLSSDVAEKFLAHGTLDLYSPIPYTFNPQMQSRITATTGKEDSRTVLLRGARVDLDFVSTDAAGNKLFTASELAALKSAGATHFQSLFSAPLRPNGGIADASFDLIPTAVTEAIAAKVGSTTASFRTEVVAKVVVYGDMSGSEITSQEFQFPVTVCNDCVVNVLTDAMGAAQTCPAPAGTAVTQGNSCNPYQDGPIDCCKMGTSLVCPATVAAAAR